MRKLSKVGEMDMNGDWLECFEEQKVQFVVLTQSQDGKLIKTLQRQSGWLTDFEGDGAVIFARSTEKGKRQ
jgi:hypothetical protein